MSVLILVGAMSLGFRLGFTVLADARRLPPSVRERLDVVGPATFGALLAGGIVGSAGSPLFVPTVVGLAAAGLAASRSSQLLAPVLVGVAVASCVAALLVA